MLCVLPVKAWAGADGAAGEPVLLGSAHDERCAQWVDSVMNELTLKEKIGQLFVYTIAPQRTKSNLALLKTAVNSCKVGGLLFSGGELENQVELTNQAQRMADVPLMITFDGEWGLSMRLKGTPVFPKNMILGCVQDNRLIHEYGVEMARQCRQLGVQVNFAPVADVNINPANPVINVRSFGEDPRRVADKVIAYASGLEEGGVLSVCKHFPGHGDTDVDSHKALPVLPFSRERLDSVELYPFARAIQAGTGGMMVGHLQVPALEPTDGVPSSLSRSIIQGVLRDELGFQGLVFTDALAMKGVSGGNRSLCVRALQAGNDVLLSPPNIKEEFASVVRAVSEGTISEEDINRKCRKVLTYKYVLGLSVRPHVQLSGLRERLNTPQAADLIRRLKRAAVTVVTDKSRLLPFYADTSRKVALLEVGEKRADALAERLSGYSSLTRFHLRPHLGESQARRLRDSLAAYGRVVVAITAERLAPYQSFLGQPLPDGSAAVCLCFAPMKTLSQARRAVESSEAVVVAHYADDDLQRHVADVLFGRATADGRLSASVGDLFPAGEGVTVAPRAPLRFVPEEFIPAPPPLRQVDSIAIEGIRLGAYPGCQVVALKDGRVLLDKTLGTRAGEGGGPVRATDIYDLASLSKMTGTLLALMKLYDGGRFNLSDKLSIYLPFLRRTDKENITIREVLLHQSGLPAGIALYPEAIDKESYKGGLFSGRKDARHPLRLGTSTWANPRFSFKKEYVSATPGGGYDWQICDSLWLNPTFRKELERKIVEAPMRSKVYRYSDVGFVLLRLLVERLADEPMDAFLQREFYIPMGLDRTGYLPLRRFSKEMVVPSSVDRFLRKTTLQGFVHDETAAFQGGVSGNAGLFSTAREVAQICQMLLNGGELYGRRYLSRETCRLFTTEVSAVSRRGLGVDKPDLRNPDKNPCCVEAPAEVYGHTGFTGTCAWIDPRNGLVYVFLSNRVYPDATNTKLMRLKIRERIQGVLYKAIEDL